MNRLKSLLTAVSRLLVLLKSWIVDFSTDYPAYELYMDALRQGVVFEESGRQLRLILGHDRRTTAVLKV